MCKYKMDLANIVKDTEWTQFCPQTDRQMDRRTDMVKPVYPPFSFIEAGGITRKMELLNAGYHRITTWSWQSRTDSIWCLRTMPSLVHILACCQQILYHSVLVMPKDMVITVSHKDLLPVRHQGITWTNADLCSIGPLGKTSLKFKWKN